jgi:hypothetical protein
MSDYLRILNSSFVDLVLIHRQVLSVFTAICVTAICVVTAIDKTLFSHTFQAAAPSTRQTAKPLRKANHPKIPNNHNKRNKPNIPK